ncbi:MAG: Inositol-pentakisphosphate 2-kinase [Trizodia sp. TS-e1964]|nr:MAG: Inositol-pentakisphosphate 2-kinase [Trizodia sp. TS-e1964]
MDKINSIPPLLPLVDLQYLAEGAANVIYRFPHNASSKNPEPGAAASAPAFEYLDITASRLLRLKKHLPSSHSNLRASEALHAIFSPLFPADNLVAQDLVELPEGLVPALNRSLRRSEDEGKRPARRHGTYLDTGEKYGFLVTDMTPNHSLGEILVEFKPKWLCQSPNAPSDARRCRTCALRAQKNAARRQAGAEEEAGFCPLDLVASEQADLERVTSFLTAKVPQQEAKRVQERVMAWLQQTPLLLKIRQLQQELDPIGILDVDAASSEFLTAMTLRDCTIFLKIPLAAHQLVDARIGDLDMKIADGGKAEYWRAMEKDLIEGGWYSGTEDPKRPLLEHCVCLAGPSSTRPT